MPHARNSARPGLRVLLPVIVGTLFAVLALVGGDGPGGAPTGWYAAYFAAATAPAVPALFSHRWPQRFGLGVAGLLQIIAGLLLILAGVGVLLIASGGVAIWGAIRPGRRERAGRRVHPRREIGGSPPS